MSVDTDFIWGVTTSSLASEGVAPTADWSAWERTDRVPPSLDGNGYATNHRDDHRLLAGLGCSDIRITVEWARLEPEPGRWSSEAVESYRDILTSARSAGLRPWVTLHHGTLPGWFSDDEGGFAELTNVERIWARHVDRCAETFEDLAGGWSPIEDPVGWAIRGYQLGTRPPGRTEPDAARDAITGALEAAFTAWRLLRSGSAPVMGVFGTPTVRRADADSSAQARFVDDLLWRSWTSCIGEGRLQLPWRAPVERPELVGAFDLIGVVYHHPIGVDVAGQFRSWPEGDRSDGTGFAPNAEELGEVVHRAYDATGRPVVVAGNGVTTDDEDWRDELLRETVRQMGLARKDGVDLRGYFHDTGIDGYDGERGFRGRRGLLDRDRRRKTAADRFASAAAAGSPA